MQMQAKSCCSSLSLTTCQQGSDTFAPRGMDESKTLFRITPSINKQIRTERKVVHNAYARGRGRCIDRAAIEPCLMSEPTSSRYKGAAEGESYHDSHLNQRDQLLSHPTLSTPYQPPFLGKVFRHRTNELERQGIGSCSKARVSGDCVRTREGSWWQKHACINVWNNSKCCSKPSRSPLRTLD